MRKDSARRTNWIWMVVTVILIVGIVGSIVIVKTIEDKNRARISGTYTCGYKSSKESKEAGITVSYKFHAKKGTYEEIWNDTTLMTGTYSVDGKEVTLVSDGDEKSGAKSEKMTFLLDKDYLVQKDYLFEGDVPKGNYFDETFQMTDIAGTKTTVKFSKDKTFSYETSSAKTKSDATGSYKREGNLIKRTRNDGVELPAFYIYKGKLASLCYKKASAK